MKKNITFLFSFCRWCWMLSQKQTFSVVYHFGLALHLWQYFLHAWLSTIIFLIHVNWHVVIIRIQYNSTQYVKLPLLGCSLLNSTIAYSLVSPSHELGVQSACQSPGFLFTARRWCLSWWRGQCCERVSALTQPSSQPSALLCLLSSCCVVILCAGVW